MKELPDGMIKLNISERFWFWFFFRFTLPRMIKVMEDELNRSSKEIEQSIQAWVNGK